jgi:hypothetical protein
MAQCPHCQLSNVVVTEEVFTRKGSVFYRFWQTIVVIGFVLFGFAINDWGLGFMLAIGGGILVSIFSLVNASKKATSKTKLSCLNCKEKTYI